MFGTHHLQVILSRFSYDLTSVNFKFEDVSYIGLLLLTAPPLIVHKTSRTSVILSIPCRKIELVSIVIDF